MMVAMTAGRGRRHERLGESWSLRTRAALEQLALGHGLAEIAVGHLGHRLRRVVDTGTADTLAGEARRVVGVLDLVPRQTPLALAAEAAHPLGRVCREAHPWLLAVVADVDASLELLLHDVTH